MATIKVIELIGGSSKSWEDAAANALEKASKTISNIRGLEAVATTAKVDGSKIVEFRTTVKIAFEVD